MSLPSYSLSAFSACFVILILNQRYPRLRALMFRDFPNVSLAILYVPSSCWSTLRLPVSSVGRAVRAFLTSIGENAKEIASSERSETALTAVRFAMILIQIHRIAMDYLQIREVHTAYWIYWVDRKKWCLEFAINSCRSQFRTFNSSRGARNLSASTATLWEYFSVGQPIQIHKAPALNLHEHRSRKILDCMLTLAKLWLNSFEGATRPGWTDHWPCGRQGAATGSKW